MTSSGSATPDTPRQGVELKASFCIRDEMSGCILITGGLGFLGSVILEALLRNCSKVDQVFLLVRGKKALTASQRVEKLLCDPLFAKLHQQVAEQDCSTDTALTSNPFLKVRAVEGDLCLPGLGLCEADKQELLGSVTHVLHAAANIELDADIQHSLKHNYFGTQALLQLSSGMHHLRSFVHVSTYFVNNHLPRNSVVKEQLHPIPLELKGRPVDCEEFVAALMNMSCDDANKAALAVMAKSNFSSTYAFGKSLTERMVVATPVRTGVQRAIVRPSLISGLLGEPYPGYITGYGGPSGYSMGYAVGFFTGAFSVAFGSDYIMDIIPCDIVAALTIAAAAKASACVGMTLHEVPIYHACSAHCHPLTLGLVLDCQSRFWRQNPPPFVLPGTRYPVFQGEFNPSGWGVALGRCIAWIKIMAVCAALHAAGKQREASLLKNAFTAFSVYNTQRYNRSILCAVTNAVALQADLSMAERKLWTLVADASVLHWYSYGYTMFAGVRRLLFKHQGHSTTEVGHFFRYKGPSVALDALGLAAGSPNLGNDASWAVIKLSSTYNAPKQ